MLLPEAVRIPDLCYLDVSVLDIYLHALMRSIVNYVSKRSTTNQSSKDQL